MNSFVLCKTKQIILLLAFLTLTTAVSADLSDYPSPFIKNGGFDAQIIVGGLAPSTDALAASDIAVSLQQHSSSQISAYLDDELLAESNAILIGLPCQNAALAAVLGSSVCDLGLAEGEGFLKIIEQNSKTYLMVSGKTAADTRKAARFLADSTNTLSGNEMRIIGRLETPISRASEPLVIPQHAIECGINDDCREDQYCLANTCLDLGCWEGSVAVDHDCVPISEEPTPEPQPVVSKPVPLPLPVVEEIQPEPDPEPEPKGLFARFISFILSLFWQ